MCKEHNGCSLCRYQLAEPWEEKDTGYYCFCEDSPHFGKVVSETGKDGPGCKCYMQSTYNDMSFLDALKILTLTPGKQEQMGDPRPYPVFAYRNSEDKTPHIAIVFKDNTQLSDWRDALLRTFSEVLDMMDANGEFKEEG